LSAIDPAIGLGILGLTPGARPRDPALPPASREARLMQILRPTLLLLSAALFATPAAALEVRQSVEVKAPPEQVWALIGGFCSIAKWHPVVGKCALSHQNGAEMRRLTTVDGAVLVEKRVQYSDEGMSYTYMIVDSPLPVSGYTSTLAVMDSGRGSRITWSGEFAAKGAPDAKALEMITGIYRAGLDALKARLG
jgi:hypothetical protein